MDAIAQLIKDAVANETYAPEIEWHDIQAAAEQYTRLTEENRVLREALETIRKEQSRSRMFCSCGAWQAKRDLAALRSLNEEAMGLLNDCYRFDILDSRRSDRIKALLQKQEDGWNCECGHAKSMHFDNGCKIWSCTCSGYSRALWRKETTPQEPPMT